jgi:hypothetical protein
MTLPSTARGWFDAMHWHLRGLFATESIRRIGFAARELWQPAEIEARRGVARDLAAGLDPAFRVDRRDGYRMLAPTVLPSIDEVGAIGRSLIRGATLADGEANTGKQFSRVRLATREQRIALLRVALDRRVLAMVADYLGVLPVITEADYFCSFPIAGPFTKSQLWHCDCDAGDVFKLFIYCDDVTADDGPLQLIEATESGRIRDAIGYRYAGSRYRVSDAVMDRHVSSAQIHSVTGSAGTAFVVETTRCFHRGSRIVDSQRRRVMASVCYCPASAMTVPRRLAWAKAPLVDFATDVTGELERAVLGLPLANRWI